MPTLMPNTSRRVAAAVVAAALAAAAPPAGAQLVELSGEGINLAGGSGPFAFAFLLPQSPAPSEVFATQFVVNGVSGRFVSGGTETTIVGQLRFYTAANSGGFRFFGGPSMVDLLDVFSQQLFTGSTSAPTLTPVTDVVPTGHGLPTARVTRFSITPAVVPEPGTWALLGTGLLGVGGASWRRRRVRS